MKLELVRYPDERLRQRSVSVVDVSATTTQRLVDDMLETMYHENGIGLAAIQVGNSVRLFVTDLRDGSGPLVFVNPELISFSGSTMSQEGCLSLPGRSAVVERHQKLSVRALDRDGRRFELATVGLLSIVVQHEMDHLDGMLMID